VRRRDVITDPHVAIAVASRPIDVKVLGELAVAFEKAGFIERTTDERLGGFEVAGIQAGFAFDGVRFCHEPFEVELGYGGLALDLAVEDDVVGQRFLDHRTPRSINL
jgi:hypothetical protein